MEQRLRRHAPDVRARPAEPALVDDRDATRRALASLVRGGLAGRAGADDDEVELVHQRQPPGAVVEGGSPRWRRASYSSTAAAIETLRLSATPEHRQAGSSRRRRRSRRRSRPLDLAAEHDRDGAAQVGLGVRDRGVRPGPRARGCRASRSHAADLRGRRGGQRDGEHRAQRGPDGVRVEQVRPRVGGDHGVGARPVRGPEHRAEVAGLLDALERPRRAGPAGRSERRRATCPGCAPTATIPSAAVAVGEPVERRRRRPASDLRPGRAPPPRSPRCPRARAGLVDEDLDHRGAAGERPGELAGPVDEREPGLVAGAPVAQGRRGPDARIAGAAQRDVGHAIIFADPSACGRTRPAAEPEHVAAGWPSGAARRRSRRRPRCSRPSAASRSPS